MQYLRADTITEVTIGPAVAVGDGFTPVTTLTVAGADEAELIKHGATTTTAIAGTLAAITGADGYYALDLSATDTDTEGRLVLLINDDSLILPIRHEFMVMNANAYDSLFAAAGTDVLQVDVTQLGGVAQSATDLKDFADAGYDPATNKVQGVVLVDTTTTNTDMRGTDNAALASGVTVTTNNDKTGYSLTQLFPTNFADLSITATTGLVDITQAAADKAWATAARTLTANTNFNDPTAAAIAGAVLDEALAGHVTVGTLGKAITDLDAEDGSSYTAIPWNASWDAEIESEVTDGLTAYNAVATTDLPANFNGLTISGGIVNADVKKINAIAVIGAGTSGNLWRA